MPVDSNPLVLGGEDFGIVRPNPNPGMGAAHSRRARGSGPPPNPSQRQLMVFPYSGPTPDGFFIGNRLFQGLPPELAIQFGAQMALLSYDEGELVFDEGEAGDCLYLLCQGSVRISKTGRGGLQETLGFIEAGEFFGEMSLIDGQPRSARVMATGQPTVLACLDRATLDRIMAQVPSGLHLNFLRSVVQRLRSVNSTFVNELMRSERLSTVGTMANSIIHDLKSPMTVILSCADLIRARSEGGRQDARHDAGVAGLCTRPEQLAARTAASSGGVCRDRR